MKKQKKPPMEFSKKILLCTAIIAVAVLIAGFVLMFIAKDLTPLPTAFHIVGAAVTAGLSFYYWKAKAENIVKLSQNGLLNGEDVRALMSDLKEDLLKDFTQTQESEEA